MGTELEISKRQEMLATARQKLGALLDAPRISEADAGKAVRLLIDAYPNAKIASPDVYMRMLRNLLVGQPADLLMRFADPRNGIMLDHPTFPPSPGEVAIWLDKATAYHRATERALRNQIETLAPPSEAAPTPQERVRRHDTLSKLADAIQPGAPDLDWLKPEPEQTPATRRDDERLRRLQRIDTPENRAKLLETDFMREEASERLPVPHRESA